MKKQLMAALILLFILTNVISCSTVRVSESDPTPPEATIVMSRIEELNRYEHEEIIMGTLTNVVIIAHGHDPDGGIRNTSLTGNIQIRCDNPENGESSVTSDDFAINNPDPVFPPLPDRAKKLRTVIFNVTPEVTANWRAMCINGTEFKRLQANFIASTINFSGQTDSSNSVTIRMLGQ